MQRLRTLVCLLLEKLNTFLRFLITITMDEIEEYKNYWERDKRRYVLLQFEENETPSIYNWYHHSMVLLDVNTEIAIMITEKMKEAGVEVFRSFSELYKKYCEITSAEKRRKMEEFKDPNLN